MASILGLLEEREAAARVRAEELAEAAALAAAVLEAAEVQLQRRVIAREELVDALAVSAAETAVITEDGGEKVAPHGPDPEPVAASAPGAVVPAKKLRPRARHAAGNRGSGFGPSPRRLQPAQRPIPPVRRRARRHSVTHCA